MRSQSADPANTGRANPEPANTAPAVSRSAPTKQVRPDPMSMRNQPALQTSGGAVWLVMGALFALIAIGTLVAIAVTSTGGATIAGWGTAAAVLVLFTATVITRMVSKPGRRRLLWMAGFFLSMAAVALVGVWLTAFFNAAALVQ